MSASVAREGKKRSRRGEKKGRREVLFILEELRLSFSFLFPFLVGLMNEGMVFIRCFDVRVKE